MIVRRLSQRAATIKPSPTLAMNKRVAELQRQGRDIIALSLGEPDFQTPDTIKIAGIAAIDCNFTKYTASDGCAELKAAIVRKLRRENDLEFGPRQIVVSSGAKIAILAALLSAVDPGDEAIIPAPYWVSYPDVVSLAGGVPVPACTTEADGFKLTAEVLESTLSSRTRALILNSPHNPTGAVYTQEEMRSLSRVLANWPNVWVITDELYEHLVYDGRKSVSFANAAPELAQRTVTINGFSKGYVMTGWRLGFAAGPEDVMQAMANLLSQMHGSPSSIAQAAAIAALDDDQSFLSKNLGAFSQRRDVVVELTRTIPGLSLVSPEGAFYAFVGCAGMIGKVSPAGRRLTTDSEVVEALLEEASVSAVPGNEFGTSPYFRISYAIETRLLKEAMGRISRFVSALGEI